MHKLALAFAYLACTVCARRVYMSAEKARGTVQTESLEVVGSTRSHAQSDALRKLLVAVNSRTAFNPSSARDTMNRRGHFGRHVSVSSSAVPSSSTRRHQAKPLMAAGDSTDLQAQIEAAQAQLKALALQKQIAEAKEKLAAQEQLAKTAESTPSTAGEAMKPAAAVTEAAPPAPAEVVQQPAADAPSEPEASNVLSQIQAIKQKLQMARSNAQVTEADPPATVAPASPPVLPEVVQEPAAAAATPPMESAPADNQAPVDALAQIAKLKQRIADVQQGKVEVAQPPPQVALPSVPPQAVQEQTAAAITQAVPEASKAVEAAAPAAAAAAGGSGTNPAVVAIGVFVVVVFYFATVSFTNFFSDIVNGKIGRDVPEDGKNLNAQQIIARGIMNLQEDPVGWLFGDEPTALYSNLPPRKPGKMVPIQVPGRGFGTRTEYVPEDEVYKYADEDEYEEEYEDDVEELVPAMEVAPAATAPESELTKQLRAQKNKAADLLKTQQEKAAEVLEAAEKATEAQRIKAEKIAAEVRAKREIEAVEYMAEAEVAWANSWEEPEPEVYQRNALDIFSKGLQNLQKEPLGWFYGKPSALYSNLW